MRLIVDAYRGTVLERAALGRSGEWEGWEAEDPRLPRGALQGRAGPPSPYDEMPNAPRAVPSRPPAPTPERREAARTGEAPIASAPLPSPADPRLAPGGGAPAARVAPAPKRREAARPVPAPDAAEPPVGADAVPDGEAATEPAPKPRRDPARTAPSGAGISGLNPGAPGAGAARPAARLPRPPAPAASTDSKPPPATAEATPAPGATPERRPVRVIGGVTPMNAGQQSTPAPQANPDGSAKPAQ